VDDLFAETVGSVAAASGFSGVLRVDRRAGESVFTRAFGLADRAHGTAMTPDTRIAVASGGKTFTALTVLRLVEDGVLTLDTPARDLLADDLPLIDDRVTVEQLLCHRSGIGDYFDEDLFGPTDHVLPVPVHQLDRAESYLPILDGFPQAFPPGTDFRYNNGAFCVLAILAERAGGRPFHDLVRSLVIESAGLHRTAYLRSDELPADAAIGYVTREGLRTNVLHLPVIGGGDGGIFTTVDDVHRLWAALEAGEVIGRDLLADAWRTRSSLPDDEGYGLGFWTWGSALELKGGDVGAALYGLHVPGGLTWTIMSNVTGGLSPLAGRVNELLLGDRTP
jgi:CubicO group peptidase (beta-lactamase class C family)